MGCTENRSDDEDYNEERHRRRVRQGQNYMEDEDSNFEEEEFKDFEEVGSKLILFNNNIFKNIFL